MSDVDVAVSTDPIEVLLVGGEPVAVVVGESAGPIVVSVDDDGVGHVIVSSSPVDVAITDTPVEVTVDQGQDTVVVSVLMGAPGISFTEVYDSVTTPIAPTFPYIRIERDIDGDIQSVYVGTVD